MKRLGIIAALSALLVALAAAPALATQTTTVNPANAPNGTHLQTGTIGCTVSANGSVSCTGFELAGVGHTNATANLSVTYSATVVCVNNGGNLSDSQHQGTFSTDTSTGPIHSDKNGRLTVPQLGPVNAPSEQQFLAQQSCPNPKWHPELSGGITLQSFTYTLTFQDFSGAYITITGNDP